MEKVVGKRAEQKDLEETLRAKLAHALNEYFSSYGTLAVYNRPKEYAYEDLTISSQGIVRYKGKYSIAHLTDWPASKKFAWLRVDWDSNS